MRVRVIYLAPPGIIKPFNIGTTETYCNAALLLRVRRTCPLDATLSRLHSDGRRPVDTRLSHDFGLLNRGQNQ